MKKCLDGLPPFTYNSVVKYVRTSGKSIQQSLDYMVMKLFEHGVNFFIEEYLHDVVAHHHAESQMFYSRALCYRSLRNSEAPHKLRLAISTKQPDFDVLGLSCTCVAGSLGFCNHAIWLMYLVSHFFMTKIKVIPDDLASTSLPQQWHKPRGKTISSEPLMDMIFEKPKLEQANAQAGNPKSRLSGISCSLYPALKVIPSSTEIENFKSNLQEINGKFGLTLYMTAGIKMVPTKIGPARLGGYLSYQLAPTEGNFEVRCNVDFSRGCSDNDLPLTSYPHFPLSLVLPLFTMTQCPREHQQFLESWQLNENDAPHLKRTPSHGAVAIDGGRKGDQGLLHLNLAIFWFENQLQSLF